MFLGLGPTRTIALKLAEVGRCPACPTPCEGLLGQGGKMLLPSGASWVDQRVPAAPQTPFWRNYN